MTNFFSTIIPKIIILLPIPLFFAYRMSIKINVRKKILISGALFMILGLTVPWIATFVSANGLAAGMTGDGPKCVTGAATFFYFGYLINLPGIPLFGLLFYILGKDDPITQLRQDENEETMNKKKNAT